MIHKISFAFDDASKQAYDIKVVTEGEPEIQPVRDEIVELTNTSLQLTPEVLQDLGAFKQGAKIALSLEPGGVAKLINPKYFPVASEGASLSKKFTISIRGKNREALVKLSNTFKTQRLQLGVVRLIPQVPIIDIEEVDIEVSSEEE